jgi:ATP-binding cassette subfamily B protein
MSGLIDNGAAKGDTSYMIRTGLTMLAVVGLGAVFALTRNIAASLASQRFGAALRHDMFSKIQTLSADEMDSFEGGSLVTRMTNDISQLQNFINGMMRVFFKAPILFVGAILMAVSLNPKMLIIIAPVVVLVSAIIALSMKMTYPRFAKVQKSLDKLNTTMREYLTGIRLVKAFRRFSEEEARFSESNEILSDNTIKANRILAVLSPFMGFFVNLGIAAVIFLGASWVGGGEMQVGEIMAFVTYMMQILHGLGMISNILNMFVRVKSSHERIREVISIEPGAADTPAAKNAVPADGLQTAANAVPSDGLQTAANAVPSDGIFNATNTFPATGISTAANTIPSAHILFSNVGFEYKGSTGQAALDGLNFFVPRGEILGIIGPTGSGKSTLASLLLRFYNCKAGEILISGINLNKIPEEELRAKIAIVPQTASLFTGTVRENILWGKNDATDAEIRDAADMACASEFILANAAGYETVIGQGGVNLSGGQKQRLSIARALIKRPEILVLDDCTSALDTITEAKVKRAIIELSGREPEKSNGETNFSIIGTENPDDAANQTGTANPTGVANQMTCLLITQRVSTAMSCDKILVLDSGKQVGFGTHDYLMENCEVYRDIYNSQIGGKEGFK